MAPLSFIVPLRISGHTNASGQWLHHQHHHNHDDDHHQQQQQQQHLDQITCIIASNIVALIMLSTIRSLMPFIQFISSMHVFDECLSCHSFMDLSISSLTHSPNHPIIHLPVNLSIIHSSMHAACPDWSIYPSLHHSFLPSFNMVIHWFNRFGDYYSSLCIMSDE